MNTNDTVSLTGKLAISLNGTVVQEVNNLVVTAGKGWIASRMNSASAGVMTHMAVGTGTTAAALTDKTLGTELVRQVLTTSGGTVAGAVVTFAWSVYLFFGDCTTLQIFTVFNCVQFPL